MTAATLSRDAERLLGLLDAHAGSITTIAARRAGVSDPRAAGRELTAAGFTVTERTAVSAPGDRRLVVLVRGVGPLPSPDPGPPTLLTPPAACAIDPPDTP